MTDALAAELAAALPGSVLITDPDVLASLSHDEAEWAPAGKPLGAIRAASTEEVGAIVAACAERGIPVVARGAGTGLSGGANAVDGGLILDLTAMNRILRIDTDNMIAVVQPGVVNDDLKAAVAEHGLWYPPDPASAPWSTIGGNVATNAGGLCCLKYGVTRDYVLGLQAVVGGPAGPYGTAVRLGRRTTKGVAGYDLVGLLVGAEGTLGIVTEITLRLRPARAAAPRTVVGAFPSTVAAGNAVAATTRLGLLPTALELLDRTCLQAVEEWKHLGLSATAEALLLAQIDTPGTAGEAEADALATAFRDAGAEWAEQSTDEFEAEALFAARRLAYPALERLGPVLTEDVCVPRSAVPAMLASIDRIAARHQVAIATIAHAGDGNLHPMIRTQPGDEKAREAAQAAFEEILTAALGHGGTVTGEHGVGLLKRGGMRQEIPPAALAMMQAVKQTWDPRNIFNPGKVLGDPKQRTAAHPRRDGRTVVGLPPGERRVTEGSPMSSTAVDVRTGADGSVVVQPHGPMGQDCAVHFQQVLVHTVRRVRPLRLILDLGDVPAVDPINLGALAALCDLADDHHVLVIVENPTAAVAVQLTAAGVPPQRLRARHPA